MLTKFEKIMFVVCITSLTMVLAFVIQQTVHPIADLEVGDCVREVHEAGEFTPSELGYFMSRVERIGKQNYLTTEFTINGHGHVESAFNSFQEHRINRLDSYAKVNCETGEEL